MHKTIWLDAFILHEFAKKSGSFAKNRIKNKPAAKKKNKNEKLAAAMGLIFSVFALVYYIFVAARGSSSESGEYVTCTECKEVFVSSKLFCPKCKKKVNTKSIKKVK